MSVCASHTWIISSSELDTIQFSFNEDTAVLAEVRAHNENTGMAIEGLTLDFDRCISVRTTSSSNLFNSVKSALICIKANLFYILTKSFTCRCTAA
jgi:hypothetical protein